MGRRGRQHLEKGLGLEWRGQKRSSVTEKGLGDTNLQANMAPLSSRIYLQRQASNVGLKGSPPADHEELWTTVLHLPQSGAGLDVSPYDRQVTDNHTTLQQRLFR